MCGLSVLLQELNTVGFYDVPNLISVIKYLSLIVNQNYRNTYGKNGLVERIAQLV